MVAVNISIHLLFINESASLCMRAGLKAGDCMANMSKFS
ncbi:MAG: hypothetical protein JWN76_3762 [Chitinophagaceae bacterium]|nr:hypothetical protein [Chitinophagaceae bacterium]